MPEERDIWARVFLQCVGERKEGGGEGGGGVEGVVTSLSSNWAKFGRFNFGLSPCLLDGVD